MKYSPALNADCDKLNKAYGAPARIVFRESASGSPVLVLANKYGSCEVSLFGAQVMQYRPTGQAPVFLNTANFDYALFATGEEVHGGMPVCWPWFGRCGVNKAQGHGFARYSRWGVAASEYSEELSEVTLCLALTDEHRTRFGWSAPFELELKISLAMKLTCALTCRNTGSEPVAITEGFHPYLRVRNSEAVYVRGVDGCDFVTVADNTPKTFVGDWKLANEYGSKIFTTTKNEFALIDPELKRALTMASHGNSKLVIWNPGPFTAGEYQNLGAEDYRSFVCVEPATLFRDAAYTLEPNAEHTLVVAIQSTLDTQDFQKIN